MKAVKVTAEFEVPDDATYEDIQEFFEFELGYRSMLSGKNSLASQDLPPARSVEVRDW